MVFRFSSCNESRYTLGVYYLLVVFLFLKGDLKNSLGVFVCFHRTAPGVCLIWMFVCFHRAILRAHFVDCSDTLGFVSASCSNLCSFL